LTPLKERQPFVTIFKLIVSNPCHVPLGVAQADSKTWNIGVAKLFSLLLPKLKKSSDGA
jgi:hypothetical protein